MTAQEQYAAKLVTAEEALGRIRSNDSIAVGHYGNEPRVLLRQLHTIADRVENVIVWTNNPAEVYPFMTMNELKGHIDMLSAFYGAPLRKNHASQRASFVPHNIHMLSQCMIECRKPTVFIAAVSPLLPNGCVCMSSSQQIEKDMLDVADTVICEVNPNLPVVYGTTMVPVEKVDCFVEVDSPLSTTPTYPITDVERTIAGYVASLIRDGDTIQFGIGGMPGAVAEALGDKKDLGIHTEMLSDAMAHLMEQGVVTNARKTLHPGKSVCAFAWGSQDFYRFLDHNEQVEMLPVSYVNDPFVIAQNENMVSVNTALQLDLTGQVCSESLGYTQYSGTGGATDFAYGAFHAKGGRGILAISSTTKGGTISRIQPCLSPGAVVSISRNIVDYVVTEYGIAHLRAASIRQRRDQLIAIAHPDFREELRREADKHQIW